LHDYRAGMEFREVIRRRRMVRHYTDEPLEDDVIERVLAGALRAPSGGFSQGWAFLVLTDAADRARFWPFVPTRVEQTPTMQDAPLVVIPMAHKQVYLDRYAEPDKGWEDRAEARWPVPYWYVDTGMAALLMLLTAVDEGLGAALVGVMPSELPGFKAEFGIPDELSPIGAVVVGHRSPDEPPVNRQRFRERRRPASEVIHRGQWGRR
jgi:nitroreductase